MSTRTIQEALDINYSIGITYLPSGDTVSFSAYLENFTDSFKQQWEAEDVYGRMDSILTYKNTKRNIDLTFNVPSESDIDAQANFIKLGKLIRFCYPVYEKGIQFTSDQDIDAYIKQGIRPTKFGNATLLSSPPLVGIKFANLISSNGFGGKLICKIE